MSKPTPANILFDYNFYADPDILYEWFGTATDPDAYLFANKKPPSENRTDFAFANVNFLVTIEA